MGPVKDELSRKTEEQEEETVLLTLSDACQGQNNLNGGESLRGNFQLLNLYPE